MPPGGKPTTWVSLENCTMAVPWDLSPYSFENPAYQGCTMGTTVVVKKGLGFVAQTPVFIWCRRGESNSHERKAHQILSLARLPISPLRRKQALFHRQPTSNCQPKPTLIKGRPPLRKKVFRAAFPGQNRRALAQLKLHIPGHVQGHREERPPRATP